MTQGDTGKHGTTQGDTASGWASVTSSAFPQHLQLPGFLLRILQGCQRAGRPREETPRTPWPRPLYLSSPPGFRENFIPNTDFQLWLALRAKLEGARGQQARETSHGDEPSWTPSARHQPQPPPPTRPSPHVYTHSTEAHPVCTVRTNESHRLSGHLARLMCERGCPKPQNKTRLGSLVTGTQQLRSSLKGTSMT